MKQASKVRDPLKQAIASYRAHAPESEQLSIEARSAVFREVSVGNAPGPLAQLFMPLHRLTALAGISLTLVLALVLWGGAPIQLDGEAANDITAINAAKVGNHLIVSIANGGTEHVVTRSERPDRFDPAAASTVRGGEFVDRLDTGANLVFYRID